MFCPYEILIFTEPFQQLVNPTGQEKGYNSSCFDITFTALFYKCDAFDRVLLLRNSSNDQIQQSVQQLLANGFVNPLRNSVTPKYALGYSDQLYETIAHLCSSYLGKVTTRTGFFASYSQL